MQTNMSYLGAKQDVMAENISNSNTPGYDVKTIAPLDFKSVLGGTASKVTMAATSANHFAGSSSKANSAYDVGSDRNPFEITPTGNKVVLEQEMMKLAENNMEYQQTTSVYRKMLSMMKMALGDANG